MSEWAKCDNIVKEPKRRPVKIPKYIKEEFSFLGKSFKVQNRAVKNVAPAFKPKVKKDEDDDDIIQ